MPYLSDYKAILFDVDNTINNSKKIITQATQDAVKALPETVYPAVCTGRIFASLTHYVFPFFPAKSIHVTAGGAEILTNTGEVLWSHEIDGNIARELCEQLLAVDAEFLISQDRKMLVTEQFHTRLVQGDIPINLGSIKQAHGWQTPLISIPSVTPEIRTIVEKFPKLTVKEMTNSRGGAYFDITAEGVNKSTALDKWSEITGIALDDCIGFGDSSNDLEFLEKVGFSVAMGNSIPELKVLAKRTIGNTDDDGLAVYLRQISQGAEL